MLDKKPLTNEVDKACGTPGLAREVAPLGEQNALPSPSLMD
jgi:hypothetical protein